MRYFLDTEFIEDGKTIDLLSIGIVADDGREFYAESTEADLSRASEWVAAHVLPSLHLPNCDGGYPATTCVATSRAEIAADILAFCDSERYGTPEFWGYYADYDWVALCQLFGTMMDLPKGWPMYCRDLRQWADQLDITGDLDGYVNSTGEHHALADAHFNAAAYDFLEARANKKRRPITHPDWMSPEGQAFRERFAYSPDIQTFTPLGFFCAGAEWARQQIARARPVVPPRPRANPEPTD
jgi:hypothetical protein